jgi:acylpyruvate hydrolase
LPWEKSKAFNGSAFVSKMLPFQSSMIENTIDFHLNLNENLVQSGNSSLMIWNVFELIEDISKYFTLKTGDYVFTGTPAGVGPVQKGDLLSGYLTNEKLFDLTIL